MPHFKAPDNTLHFLSDEDVANGGIALLPKGSTEITDAQAATAIEALQPKPTAADLIRTQITELEMQQTPRRMREAALGIDGGWLASLDEQIQVLRAQLA